MSGRRQFLPDATSNIVAMAALEARQEALGALVPGVILQPLGVRAAHLAQKHGCAYLHAR